MASDIITPILLGIVEGVTEYLPVSSTGHLILATELLGYDAEKWALFNIAIQPGAILAIIVLYWRTFWDVFQGLLRWEASAVAFVRNLLLAFFPAVVLGLAFGDHIETLLENAVVVCWSLIIGGFAILLVERLAKPKDLGGVAEVGVRNSIMIGLVQCLAMVPGVSRSGATILGAMAFGVDRKTAAEFSFFLAVPTLTGGVSLRATGGRSTRWHARAISRRWTKATAVRMTSCTRRTSCWWIHSVASAASMMAPPVLTWIA